MRKQITLYDDQYAFYKELKSEKLLVAFVEYMFEDVEPQWLNSLEQTIRNSLVVRMDNLKKKSVAWSKSRWWGRPKKTTDITTEKKEKKQQKNNTKTTEKQQVKVEDKDKVKDNINNNLSPIGDKEQSSYWDENINKCLEIIKKFNWWISDWTQKEQRIYWKNLIWKLKEIDSVKNWNYTRDQVLETILQIVSQNTYHAQKIAWPKKIYYELWWLMQICKSEFAKKKKQEIPFIPWIW